jgi:hypothetical protein
MRSPSLPHTLVFWSQWSCAALSSNIQWECTCVDNRCLYKCIYIYGCICISVYVYVLTSVREVPGTLQGRPRVLEPTLSATFHRAIADPLAPWWSSHCGYTVAPLPFLAVFGRRSLNPISQFVEADGLLTFHGRISFEEGPDIGDVSTPHIFHQHSTTIPQLFQTLHRSIYIFYTYSTHIPHRIYTLYTYSTQFPPTFHNYSTTIPNTP